MAKRDLKSFVCIDCGNGFISSERNLNKRALYPGIIRCNDCHEPLFRESTAKKLKGHKVSTPQKKVRTLEQAKTVLKPSSQKRVWAKCETCKSGFQQQYKYLYVKVQRGYVTCNHCEYAYTGKQKVARQKTLWHSELLPYVETNKPFPLELALKYAGNKSQYPIVFDCKVCGNKETFKGIGSLRSREHYKDEPICKPCYYKTPEYVEQKSKNYSKRLDKPLAMPPYKGVYHSKWGDINFDSLQGELGYLLELENNEMVSSVCRAMVPVEYEYNGAKRRYYPDFFVTYRDRDPQVVEIKGWNRVPAQTQAKLEAAEKWCKTMGFYYKYIGSKDIEKVTKKTIDELVRQNKVVFSNRKYGENNG